MEKRHWAALIVMSLLNPPTVAGALDAASVAGAGEGSQVFPSSPGARICGSGSLLDGPTTPPAGAVVVEAGDGTISAATEAAPPGTTFWMSGGVHMLGSKGIYHQVVPKEGNTYIGAPGAVLDGSQIARYAFTGRAGNVTVKFLTIQRFGSPGTNNNQGVVNHDGGDEWTIEYNSIRNNAGAGLFIGSGNVVRSNCLSNNEQYGFSMFSPPLPDGSNAIVDITLDGNEIAGNNTYDWEMKMPGCGCSGGGKFWDVAGARITGNWVHHNKGAGLWADTNNIDFMVEGNYIEENDGAGLFYELSYNATVRNNTFRRNAIKRGMDRQARGSSFPEGAIYVSEAGGDGRVSSTVTGSSNLMITGNSFVDNWDGVVLWENADRFFNSPANTSGTAYAPKGGVASMSTCSDPATGGSITSNPAFSDCRWMTKNVKVTGNSFAFDAAEVSCTTEFCGRNAMFSQYGTFPSWSPYKGWVVADAITAAQGNVWSNNTYAGPWRFMARDMGRTVSPATWQSAPYHQDAGSTFTNGSTTTTSQPITTTTTTAPPATTTTTEAAPATTTALPAAADHLSTDTATFEGSAGSWAPWFSSTLARSTFQPRSGSAGGRIDVTNPYGWGVQLNNWPGFVASAGPKTIGFWSRLGAGTNLGATLTVRWRNDSGNDLQVDRLTIAQLTTTWQQATSRITAPAGTTRIWVELTNAQGRPGDHLYIDDVQVAPGANHLDGDSAGFEDSLGRWAPWYSAGISRTAGGAAFGRSTARVDVKAPHGWGVQLDNWPGFPASPGVRSIGFWGRAGTGSKLGATMTLRWRNEAGTTLQIEQVTIPVLSGSWQEARALVTAPAGTARVHVDFSHGSGRSGDSIYLDGIHAGS